MIAYNRLICFCLILLLPVMLAGCASFGDSRELRRMPDTGRLPFESRIGVVALNNCGAAYMDRLSREYHKTDARAILHRRCTDSGFPEQFTSRFRKRLEARSGRQMVALKSEKPFSPRHVFRDAEKLTLDYIIAGDLLYRVVGKERVVISAFLYALSVKEKKIVMYGRIKKSGPLLEQNRLLDEMADEFYEKAASDA